MTGRGPAGGWRWAAAVVLALAGGGSIAAESLWIQQESQIDLEGTSTVSAWSCVSARPEGAVALGMPAKAAQSRLDRVLAEGALAAEERSKLMQWADTHVQAQVRLDVVSLDCGNRAMERDLEHALKAGQFPVVSYTFKRLAGASLSTDAAPPRMTLHTEGILELAGVGRDVALDLQVTGGDDGCVVAESFLRIRMTEFGVTPPRALWGLIQARDPVDIHFRLHFAPEREQIASTD